LGVKDIKTKQVNVPEWGGMLILKEMNGVDRESWEASLFPAGKKDLRQIREKLLVRTIVDENGDRIFGDKDIEALSHKSGQVLDRLFDAAQRLNGLRTEDIEEREKNSQDAESGDSILPSPATSV
jgi:hypothetical protein